MIPLTEQAHALIRDVLQPGDIAIDATAGNGHDTLFLADQVGSRGHVFALDIQPRAIEQTRQRLENASHHNVTLLQRSHAELQEAIPSEFHGKVAAIMFNLGYLPGGDKSIITEIQSTLMALQSAFILLRTEGVISILAYVGHAGGIEEANAVREFLENNSEFQELKVPAHETSPRLYLARKVNRTC